MVPHINRMRSQWSIKWGRQQMRVVDKIRVKQTTLERCKQNMSEAEEEINKVVPRAPSSPAPSQDFEEEINKVLSVLPRERRTFLFSATMTSKVAKLQRACLKNPVRVRKEAREGKLLQSTS